ALSMSLLINEVDSVLAFGNLLDSIFVLKEDVVDSRILSNMIFMLLNSEDNRGINSLFYAFQGGHVDTVFAFGALIDRLLLMKGHVSDNYMASMIFRLLSCENDNGFPGLFYAFQGGHADTVRAFGTLMDRLLVMKGYVSDNYMASMIFRLLSCENNNGLPGLFYAFQEGHAYTVRAFGALIDRLFIMRGYIEDVVLLDMVFSLLICKSGDNGVPGLFVAMQNGHHSTVDAFRELLEKTVIFKNDTSSEYFNNIILDIIISRRSDGVSGLSVALKNNFSEVVKCYGLLLNLIPKYELVNVLVASDNCDIPAALFAGKEALDSYLMIISSLPTSAIYALYSRLSSIRMSIIHTPLSNSDLDGRYKALLKKVKKLAIRSVPNIVIT
uniref:hypothetical protein n=1 Tax=Candidatus Ichthyocystis sparus TaxID=1561004 RepID=UPI00159EF488